MDGGGLSGSSSKRLIVATAQNGEVRPLIDGWNILYVKNDRGIDSDNFAVCEGAMAFSITDGRVLRTEAPLLGGKTYLVRVRGACTVSDFGAPVFNNKVTLQKGWNLAGASVRVSFLQSHDCGEIIAYSIKSTGGLQAEGNSMSANMGYLIRSEKACELKGDT